MRPEAAVDLIWERTACSACGSVEEVLLFEGSDRMLKLPGTFRVVRCTRCGLVRQDPRLAWESLQHYYREEYGSYTSIPDKPASSLQRLSWRYGQWKLLRAIGHFQRGGRLLDVGCGNGIFLAEAQRTGRWDVTGIEPTESAAANARRAVQAPILSCRFSEAELPAASFDVITMWNVLEHLPDPVADLRRAHTLLKPGGWLILAIPNMESLAVRVFGSRWLGWELPRHLYMFPRRSLDRILASVGFRVARRQCLSLSYATLGANLEFWSQDWQARHPALARWMLRLYYTPVSRLALALPLWVLDRLNLSTVINIFAQKVPN